MFWVAVDRFCGTGARTAPGRDLEVGDRGFAEALPWRVSG